MALYKDPGFLSQSGDAAFDTTYKPGTAAPYSGIYRCCGCAYEVASNATQPLPPQNHHQHPPAAGEIRWQLIVYAEHKA